jgi:hypothetical protein
MTSGSTSGHSRSITIAARIAARVRESRLRTPVGGASFAIRFSPLHLAGQDSSKRGEGEANAKT